MIRKNKSSTNFLTKVDENTDEVKQMSKTNSFLDSYAFCKNIDVNVKNKLK